MRKKILMITNIILMTTNLIALDIKDYHLKNIDFALNDYQNYFIKYQSEKSIYIINTKNNNFSLGISFIPYTIMVDAIRDEKRQDILSDVIEKKSFELSDAKRLMLAFNEAPEYKFNMTREGLFSSRKEIKIKNCNLCTIILNVDRFPEDVFRYNNNIYLYTYVEMYFNNGTISIKFAQKISKKEKISDLLGTDFGPYEKNGNPIEYNKTFAEKLLNELLDNKFSGSKELQNEFNKAMNLVNTAKVEKE